MNFLYAAENSVASNFSSPEGETIVAILTGVIRNTATELNDSSRSPAESTCLQLPSMSPSVVVRAVEPTILGDQKVYHLRDNDLALFSVSTAIVVPGAVDDVRLKSALARALAIFPLYAGRVEKRDGQWLVRLSNEGALFDVVDSDSEEPPVTPDAPVAQAPFTLTHSIDQWALYSGTSNEPLLRITLTRGLSSRWSVVGFSTAHVAGDGGGVRAFMRTLSRSYLDLEPLEDDIPVYDYPPNAPATEEEKAQIETPWYHKLVPLESVRKGEIPAVPCVRINLRLSAPQLVELRKGILARGSEGVVPEPLSTQDSLVAALADAISRTHIKHGVAPMTRVTTALNYRGVGPVPRTAACNALIQAIADLPPHTSSQSPSYVYDLASSVRRSLLLGRSYDAHTRANIAVSGSKILYAANNVLTSDFTTLPGVMHVNSTRPFDWTAAHFGYEGKARFFHTALPMPRYVKIFTPNPTPDPVASGGWKEHKSAAEVTFFIEPDMKTDFIDDFLAVVAELGVKGAVEFVA